MGRTAQVSEEDGNLYITFRLPGRQEVSRLAFLMTAAADWHSFSQREGALWRRIGADLKAYADAAQKPPSKVKPKKIRWEGRGRRPSEGSEIDVNHVLYGHEPYPMLSDGDMRTVYPVLESRRMSARQIAERLHVHRRTVSRWRKRAKTEKGKK